MRDKTCLTFERRPNLLRIYVRALMISRKGLKPGESLPRLASECSNVIIDAAHLQKFRKITGAEGIPLTYPELLVFPFHMPMIGHEDFPLPYVSMMQIRNHMVQHGPLDGIDRLHLACRIAGQRTAAKGLEMDLHSVASSGGQSVWECLNTYYFPGRFGNPDPPSLWPEFEPLPSDCSEQNFKISSRGGFRFGLLSGDYNGIHYASWYARSRGFRRSFAQSYNSLSHCMRRLPRIETGFPIRLDTAYKGPVYYDTDLTLKYVRDGDGYRFDLYCEGDPRPCMVAKASACGPDQGVLPWQSLNPGGGFTVQPPAPVRKRLPKSPE